ncbi:MAG: hypothetical protein M3Y55_15115 [Pseudomonadota bacterium]|nr:hypothetical protein [Pseudomonadota bacterium]
MTLAYVRRKIACGAVVALWAALLGATSASAGPATTIQSELSGDGVPNVSVTVVKPAPATASDVVRYQADPSGSYASLTPANELSADPTNPQPVATISFGPSSATPFPGVVVPPGARGVFVEDADVAVWESDAMEAVKHAVAGGTPLAGVALDPRVPYGDDAGPAAYVALPDSTELPASGPLVAAPKRGAMPASAVQQVVQTFLPIEYSGASIAVSDEPGGQRTLEVQFDQPPAGFASNDLTGLIAYADQEALTLSATGADVGQVIVTSVDPSTGNPLLTYAGDPSWGQSSRWVAPIIAAFVDQPGSGIG